MRENEQFLKKIFDSIQDGISVIDINFKVIKTNRWMEEIYGHQMPLVGKKCYQVYQGKNSPCQRCPSLKSIKTGDVHTEVVPYPSETNPEGWIELFSFPVKDEKGRVTHVIEYVKDITARKKAEEALWESKEKFRSLVELTSDWIWEVDRNGTYTYSSPQIKRLLGYESQDLVGEMTPFDLMPADEAKKISAFFKNIIASRKAFDGLENTNIHKDGHTVLMETGACPFFDVDGNLMGYRGVDRDITQRKRMEEMMIQSEKMLSVGGLAAGMAHEINNPLAGMIQSANVMKSRLENINMPANLKVAEELGITMDDLKSFMEKRGIFRMLDAIHDSGTRAAEIVSSMLSFARKSDAAISSHYPDQLMDKILELAATDYDLKKQYDFKSIKIIKQYADGLPLLPCDGAKIQQVLLNILRNGAQAMQTAKTEFPRFIIRIYKTKEPEMVCMEIEDNGPGMDEDTRSKVFDPFFTTKPVGIGTGLGLSISYFIITENHKGTINVFSQTGNGAKFIIRLPVETV